MEMLEIGRDGGHDLVRQPEGAVRGRDIDSGMEGCHRIGDGVDLPGGDFRFPVQGGVGGEGAHFHRPFQGGAVASDAGRVRAPGDWHHVQVDVRCQAAVEADFRFAAGAALVQGGEIQEAQIQGFLQLVGVFPGQDHPGDVGLDEAWGWGLVGIGSGLEQLGDQGSHLRNATTWSIPRRMPIFSPMAWLWWESTWASTLLPPGSLRV